VTIPRYTGTCELLCDIDVGSLVSWIADIPYEDWPQQHRLSDGKLRPAMACDQQWHGFASVTDPLVADLMARFPGCIADTRMLSAVMPGHSIASHRDAQGSAWRCRVHVPLLTNSLSSFMVGGVNNHLEPGKAYLVNTEAEHAVTNDGQTPRVHFMFDVRLG
jgi:hypothetical protein